MEEMEREKERGRDRWRRMKDECRMSSVRENSTPVYILVVVVRLWRVAMDGVPFALCQAIINSITNIQSHVHNIHVYSSSSIYMYMLRLLLASSLFSVTSLFCRKRGSIFVMGCARTQPRDHDRFIHNFASNTAVQHLIHRKSFSDANGWSLVFHLCQKCFYIAIRCSVVVGDSFIIALSRVKHDIRSKMVYGIRLCTGIIEANYRLAMSWRHLLRWWL